jgi:hypothetical protein
MKSCLFILLLTLSLGVFSRTHLIYSVGQDIPMGYDNEVIKKNFYLNIGTKQGVSKGTKLDVYRVVSRRNPYDNGKRINHKVKVGVVEVIHSEDESAIAIAKKNLFADKRTPSDDIASFMIGDHVEISIED